MMQTPFIILTTFALVLFTFFAISPIYAIAAAIVSILLVSCGVLISSFRANRLSNEPQPDSVSEDHIVAAQKYYSLIQDLSDKYRNRDVYPAITYDEDLEELEIAICEGRLGELKIIESIGSMYTLWNDNKIECFDDGRRVIYPSSPCLMPLLAYLLAEEMKKPLAFLIPNTTAPRNTIGHLVAAFRSLSESPFLPSSSAYPSTLWM